VLPVLPLGQMTVEEKLQLMEILWDDLSQNAADVPSPAWHGEVLADRERAIKEGRTQFLPFDEFQKRIRENI
jgi:putative addiction module component (TIGR02574 family)